MALPTAEEVTNYYLYGSSKRPDDLTDPSILEWKEKKEKVTVDVDVNEYMTLGAGRFFSAADFNVVDDFFSQDIKPGIYERAEMLTLLGYIDENGVSIGKAFISQHQINYGVHDEDYLERTYIWGSTSFKLGDDVKFIVNEDGSKEIKNCSSQDQIVQ